jgi:SAM-dependent methyltransferase
MNSIETRASEIAQFLGIPEPQALHRLRQGFGYQHGEVNRDFRRSGARESDPESLLNWYRTTEEYIWELSAYHADAGFNYSGMCGGIAERLKAEGVERFKAAGVYPVLCLGDGIGDLTLALRLAGFDAVYHDLYESRTAQFARFRNLLHAPKFESFMTTGWQPMDVDEGFSTNDFDAVVSLDFMEHVTDVPAWCRAVHAALKPGGLFCAQNAFDCGSGASGSIPCHLEVNDKFAHAGATGKARWDELLIDELGFFQESSNWYRKP